MRRDTENIGELLVKLCELSRSYDLDIRVKQDLLHPNVFEIRLDRLDNHAASLIDITRTFADEPEQAAEYAFRRSLYDIEQLEKEKKNEH